MSTEISPLELNKVERDLRDADIARNCTMAVSTDLLRRLVAVAKNPPNDALRDEIEQLNAELCEAKAVNK